MGFFPEDQEIVVDKLIRLWVAEGFLKPIYGKSLEEAAQDYLNDLIGRNLITVSESSLRGEVTNCRIHDLLRDLCLKEALEKKFFCIVQKQVLEVSNYERRLVVYPNAYEADVDEKEDEDVTVLKSPSVVRTLVVHDKLLSVVYKSLRVLVSATERRLEMSLNNMIEVTRQLVNLRCLDFSSKWNDLFSFPPSIFSIWNLQSLEIVGSQGVKVPEHIWKMSQLRHIHISDGFSLSGPPSESFGILKNLQLARKIVNFSFSEDLVERIPNVKILEVEYDDAIEGFSEGPYALDNIARLEKLETLWCWLDGVRSITRRNGMLLNLTFPHSLKNLSVSGLHLDEVTTMIGSLPLLEQLYLNRCSGSEWNHVEGQFVSLNSLYLFGCGDLKCFTADNSLFPCLEWLEIWQMDCLEEISSDIGDIQTLRSIQILWCPDSAVKSAKEIADYQKYEMGNEELHVTVFLHEESILSAESLSTSNFHVEA